MFIRRPENNYSECISPKALTPANQEDYYSTLTRGNELLNITALAMSTSSVYDKGKSTGDLHFEPMYIDVVSEGPASRKSSRRLKCLVVWLVFLTIFSLTSLAFTTVMFYNAGMTNGGAMFFGDSTSDANGKDFRNIRN